MHVDPNPRTPSAGVCELVEGIVDAVRAADSPRIQCLLDDLVKVADLAALLLLRSRLHQGLSLRAEEPERALRERR
ncbi:hypothetical protein [Streptomyces sp. H39-S7]|uniref:hypothetical protein n=1 Tax=Streptomyces sp. H39-S7 TaxID=3004357 RepID=UPI0022B07C15|nr:hypothetical protein [Streptomyces sp. H39-S7]MCZ4125057.1 hypothetical protein [Streptomyces sp. H39-S7]